MKTTRMLSICFVLASALRARAGEWVDVQPWAPTGTQPRVEYGVPPASENGSLQPRSCPSGGCRAAAPAPSYYPHVIERYSIIGDQGSPGRAPSGLQTHSVTILR